MIHIQSEHHSEQIVQTLSRLQGIAVRGAIPCWAIQKPIGAEGEVTAIVSVGFPLKDNQLTVFQHRAGSVTRNSESTDAILFDGLPMRTIADHKQVTVLFVVRMKTKPIDQILRRQHRFAGAGFRIIHKGTQSPRLLTLRLVIDIQQTQCARFRSHVNRGFQRQLLVAPSCLPWRRRFRSSSQSGGGPWNASRVLGRQDRRHGQ